MTSSSVEGAWPWRVLLPAGVGALVAVSLGVYGRVHQPSGHGIVIGPFSSIYGMKIWLTTVVAALAIWQLFTALWMYGRLPRAAPHWVARTHRATGWATFLVSLPVAYNCLWALGFQTYSPRVVIHSLLGCLLYGAFVAKVITVRSPRMPSWLLPVLGGTVFTIAIALWLTGSLWYFTQVAFPGW